MYNKQLDAFIQVYENGSFSKAAEKMFISTVSIMKQINSLEAEIGARLFNRTNQGSFPTAAGEYFYGRAKKIIEFSSESIKKTREIFEQDKFDIAIGSSSLRPSHLITERLSAIDDGTLPFQLSIIPFSDDYLDLSSALKMIGKEFDCFASSYDPVHESADYNILPLAKSKYCISLSRKHRLAKKSILSLNDLDGEVLMLLSKGMSTEIDRLRQDISDNHPGITILDSPKYYSSAVFNDCAKMEFMMGSLDIWKDLHPSLITLPVDWDIPVYYGIIYEKNPSDKVKAFIHALEKSAIETPAV